MNSKTYAPAHGGYPGTVRVSDRLNLCAREPGERAVKYRVRVVQPVFGVPHIVGTEREEVVSDLAQRFPDSIYFVTEEAFA